MHCRLVRTFGVMAAFVGTLAGCKTDPLSDLDGTPVAIVKQFSQIHLAVGDSSTVTASVVDGRFAPLEATITFSSGAAAVAVTTDASYVPVPPTSSRAWVKAVSADTTFVIIQGGGLRDSVQVLIP
jgi:hypothetical protein